MNHALVLYHAPQLRPDPAHGRDPKPGLFNALVARLPAKGLQRIGHAKSTVTSRADTPPPYPQPGKAQQQAVHGGSARRMGNRNREGGTQALAHAAIPIQVWPA